MTKNIFWITTPAEEQFVTRPKVHLAYRISHGRLLRGPIPKNTFGGMMGISQFETSIPNPNLLSALSEECSVYGYSAVFAAVSEEYDSEKVELFDVIGGHLSARKIPLIVPIAYANVCKNVSFCASSSISGGSLQEYLNQLLSTVKNTKLYIEHPMTASKFTMPTPDGNGALITREEAASILSSPEIQPFYSPELFLNYCTYRQDGNPQFLLFDDERTILAKLELGNSLGVAGQFLLYRELQESYPRF